MKTKRREAEAQDERLGLLCCEIKVEEFARLFRGFVVAGDTGILEEEGRCGKGERVR